MSQGRPAHKEEGLRPPTDINGIKKKPRSQGTPLVRHKLTGRRKLAQQVDFLRTKFHQHLASAAFGISSCIGRNGSEDRRAAAQSATTIAKFPFSAFFRSEIFPQQVLNTHVLQPGVMHCELVRWVSTMYRRCFSSHPTYRHVVAPGDLLAWCSAHCASVASYYGL
jgi:hypothetical protein